MYHFWGVWDCVFASLLRRHCLVCVCMCVYVLCVCLFECNGARSILVLNPEEADLLFHLNEEWLFFNQMVAISQRDRSCHPQPG